MLALPGTGWSTRMRCSSIEIVRTALEAYGWEATKIRPAVPSAAKGSIAWMKQWLDSADPAGSLCASTYRGRAKSGASNH